MTKANGIRASFDFSCRFPIVGGTQRLKKGCRHKQLSRNTFVLKHKKPINCHQLPWSAFVIGARDARRVLSDRGKSWRILFWGRLFLNQILAGCTVRYGSYVDHCWFFLINRFHFCRQHNITALWRVFFIKLSRFGVKLCCSSYKRKESKFCKNIVFAAT